MRVLLIEDDSATAQSIELMLKSESFNVYTTDLGEEGVDLGKLYDYDIILLNLSLPDMSGYEVLRKLRVSKVKTPILILSGIVGIEDKVKGLGFGADDYMTKPFHKDELIARIYAIIRRSKGHAQSVVQTGNLVVNLDAKSSGGLRHHGRAARGRKFGDCTAREHHPDRGYSGGAHHDPRAGFRRPLQSGSQSCLRRAWRDAVGGGRSLYLRAMPGWNCRHARGASDVRSRPAHV